MFTPWIRKLSERKRQGKPPSTTLKNEELALTLQGIGFLKEISA